ncbi:hypothetical protein GGR56DRAFT_609153 [Xylariaceae sp. FL0804]|nr:hypothetical protein GGR56DRAFT_609153 [Xylariaceae sp. FL0804]
MSTASKRPIPSASGRPAAADSSTSPSRQARASTPSSAANGANGTPTRTRSIRTGTPVSARAAASHRTTSSLSISRSAATTAEDEEARAETVALIDDLKQRLQGADAASEQHRKQADVLQARLDESLREQAGLEERAHESEEQIEALRNERREAARQMREMEAIYEAERSSMTREKEEMNNREEEMQAVINRLKDSLNQRNADDEYRPTRQSNNSSPALESGNFAPPSSMQRSDSRNTSKLLLQKDKLIESLRLELAEAQIKLVESENQGGGRLHEVERLLMEARMANARLMEDNESYQLLLQERTLDGHFGKGDFSYMGGVASNEDALNALEGRGQAGAGASAGTSLADELGAAADDANEANEGGDELARRLEAELRAAKDQNKALTLYINKIIERLLQHQDFEHILDQSTDFKPSRGNTNKDLPPPPAAEAPGVGASLLQRARSIATGHGGNGVGRPKPRPMTMLPPGQQPKSAHSNPDTAPSIPIGLPGAPGAGGHLGRSQSTAARRGGGGGRPLSEQFTGAAGIVNAMYKGPDGPLSPTLSNPSSRNSQGFFSAPGGRSSTPRVPSAGAGAPSAGNFPGMRSETSSVSGESATGGLGGGGGDGVSTHSSPPRSGHGNNGGAPSVGGGEKATTIAGNKPRPLRLVQENNSDKDKTENKRASWIGWAQSAWANKKEDGANEPIRE